MTNLTLINGNSDVVTARSTLLGELTVRPKDLLTFPAGRLDFRSAAGSRCCAASATHSIGSSQSNIPR